MDERVSILGPIFPKKNMMKILLLDPHNDAMRALASPLQAKGLVPLLCSNPSEAWQMLELHGESVELAIVFREDAQGKGDPGLDFVRKYKADPRHADLPYILLSEGWSDAEFAAHQEKSEGANAYWKWTQSSKSDLQGLMDLIEAVTGKSFGAKSPTMPEDYTHVTALTKQMPPAPPPAEVAQGVYELTLEPVEPDAEPSVFTDSFEMEISDLNVVQGTQENPEVEKKFEAQLSGSVPVVEEKPKYQAEFSPQQDEVPSTRVVEAFIQPIDDAVIPGGAAQSPDMATLKKYLTLREQDVATLSHQLRTARAQIESYQIGIREAELKRSEMEHQVQVLKERLEEREQGRSVQVVSLEKEVDELKFQVKAKTDKARLLEQKVVDATKEIESLKERVRNDIRKIRLHEKELENRLEIMKRDSEALLVSRENRILDLKRKLDLLEFNIDLLQDKYAKEQEKNQELEKRLEKAAHAMRLAGGFLGEDEIEKASGQ